MKTIKLDRLLTESVSQEELESILDYVRDNTVPQGVELGSGLGTTVKAEIMRDDSWEVKLFGQNRINKKLSHKEFKDFLKTYGPFKKYKVF